MLSKRLSVLVVVAAIVVLCTLAASAPAFAQELFRRANPHANCVGQAHSTTNALDFLEPGNVGLSHKRLAHRRLNGEFMTSMAHAGGEPGSETRSIAGVLISFPGGSVFGSCLGE